MAAMPPAKSGGMIWMCQPPPTRQMPDCKVQACMRSAQHARSKMYPYRRHHSFRNFHMPATKAALAMCA